MSEYSYYKATAAPARAIAPQSKLTKLASTLIPGLLFAFGFGPVMDVLSPAAVTNAHDSVCVDALEFCSAEVQFAWRHDVKVLLNVVERQVHCRLK